MSDRDAHAPDGMYNEEEIKSREDAPVLPEDLRDDIGSSEKSLHSPLAGEFDFSEAGADWETRNASALPDSTFGRNFRSDAVGQPTRDTSLSRDADLEASGGDPELRHGMSDGETI